MLVSYNWLNKYFAESLPLPEELAEKLTFHAWEIESVENIDHDTVIDIKVLPDKSMWALSHRGIAKDISVILNTPLKTDPFLKEIDLGTINEEIKIEIDSPSCNRFMAAHISGVKVGPSPKWLQEALEAIGQRSINNIVDASNYVMFDLGQPSHAFDARSLPEGFLVRQAVAEETITALDETEYIFSTEDTLISSLADKTPLSVAGIKGGNNSGISDSTTDIVIEIANWNPITTRKTAARLKLRSDASSRYENGIVPETIPFAMQELIDLIIDVAGGEYQGYNEVLVNSSKERTAEVTLSKINSVLGLKLSTDEVIEIINRFGWKYELSGEEFKIFSPFERTDLNIAEDVIEEIGRIYGYNHIEAIAPEVSTKISVNKNFYYSDLIRNILIEQGFSEIFTSSFRNSDEVKLSNAMASDKGYLRSSLVKNTDEALAKNTPNADLLGLTQIRLFEIGTIFNEQKETLALSIGVRSPSGYKAKLDDKVIASAIEEIEKTLNIKVNQVPESGIIEINLEEIILGLSTPENYLPIQNSSEKTYKTFSLYPTSSRDIAMWVSEGTAPEEIEKILKDSAGELCVRITQFDQFTKDGRTSYAYRLVFQSTEKTLTEDEITPTMDNVYRTVAEHGFEVR